MQVKSSDSGSPIFEIENRDRRGRDVEPEHEVERNAHMVRYGQSDEIAVTYDRYRPAVVVARALEPAHDPRLCFVGHLAAGNARAAARGIERLPSRVGFKIDKSAPSPFTEIDLDDFRRDARHEPAILTHGVSGFARTLERTRVHGLDVRTAKPRSERARLRTPGVVERNSWRAPGKGLSHVITGGVPDQQEGGHEE